MRPQFTSFMSRLLSRCQNMQIYALTRSLLRCYLSSSNSTLSPSCSHGIMKKEVASSLLVKTCHMEKSS
eukprot:12301815-Ditylum_brightwellii.AAC.1